MPSRSAGLLMYRRGPVGLEVFLAHPGGPFFAKKDLGSWTIPKGVVNEDEDELSAAQREFQEETGLRSTPPFLALGQIRQRSGKEVICWAFEAPPGLDTSIIQSNTFTMEWPPGSGRMGEFPEVDRASFFSIPEARSRLMAAQVPFLERLAALDRI